MVILYYPFSSKTLTLSEVNIIFNSDNHARAPLDAKKIKFLAKLNHLKLLTWTIECVEVF